MELGEHPTIEDMRSYVVEKRARPMLNDAWRHHPVRNSNSYSTMLLRILLSNTLHYLHSFRYSSLIPVFWCRSRCRTCVISSKNAGTRTLTPDCRQLALRSVFRGIYDRRWRTKRSSCIISPNESTRLNFPSSLLVRCGRTSTDGFCSSAGKSPAPPHRCSIFDFECIYFRVRTNVVRKARTTILCAITSSKGSVANHLPPTTILFAWWHHQEC